MRRFGHLILSLVLSQVLIGVGTAGYMVIEKMPAARALFMTVTTLSTVGFGEPQRLSQAGRLFTMALVVAGVGYFFYVGAGITRFVVEGHLLALVGSYQLIRKIRALKDHVIVCGCGRIGRVLCDYLARGGRQVVAVDTDSRRLAALAGQNILPFEGDATDDFVLERAGIGNAAVLITAVGSDADNVFIVLSARQRRPDLHIVARCSRPSAAKTLQTAGADKVISPYEIGARRMAHAVLRPAVIELLETAFVEHNAPFHMEQVRVKPESRLVGRRLGALAPSDSARLLVVAVRTAAGKVVFKPSDDTVLGAGDILVLMAPLEELQRIAQQAGR